MSWKHVPTPEGCPPSYGPLSHPDTRRNLQFMADQLEAAGKAYHVETIRPHANRSEMDLVRIWTEPAAGAPPASNRVSIKESDL